MRYSASSFNFQYRLLFLRSFSSCLPLLPLLPVTSILPSTFPSTACFRRQFLRKMWPIQLAFLLFTVRRILLSFLALCNTSEWFCKRKHLAFVSVFGKRLPRESNNTVVFPPASHMPLKPLWSPLLLHDHEPSPVSFALRFESLLMLLLPASQGSVSEFQSPGQLFSTGP